MSVQICFEDNILTVYLSGEIDHHFTVEARGVVDLAITEKKPQLLILDFMSVGFMDSSGIGFVMGRYRAMSEIGGRIKITNPPSHISKVMKISGIEKLCEIKKEEVLCGGANK